ncbi:MAG: AAA family ATPase, partial [Firmicutes bacterium]|nr:AAA family ATPase [Bacillota bacterium]
AYIGPEFTVSDNAVKVVLPCMDSRPKLTSDGRTLLNAMDSEIMMSSSELAETLGWTRDKTIRTLNMVFESGAVVKYGTGRGTRYSRR